MRRLGLIFALALHAAPAFAVVTLTARYQMGESDPGSASGASANATAQPTTGTVVLNRVGAPNYSSNVAPALTGFSTLSTSFNGSTDRFAGSVISTVTDNFGIEAWVRSTGVVTGNAAIAYNGNSGSNGYGLYRIGNVWSGLLGGVNFVGGPNTGNSVTSNWTHLALVRQSGSTLMYVNGVPGPALASAPGVPSGGFGIGGQGVLAISEFFDGQIDEVRFFTFAPGAFNVGDLLLVAPRAIVQAPSNNFFGTSLMALLLFAVGSFAVRRF